MSFDYRRLRGKITEVFGTQKAFARELGISRTSLSMRLNNTADFSQTEIKKSLALLNIDGQDICQYFFTPLVQKSEH